MDQKKVEKKRKKKKDVGWEGEVGRPQGRANAVLSTLTA
jgi:hypothetical protein